MYRIGKVVLGLAIIVLLATACSTAPVDTDAIAATVRAQLEAELASAPATATVASPAASEETPPTAAAPTIVPVREESIQLAENDLALQDALIDLYQAANPSVVYVIVPPLGSGSGFVYDTEGHIVTNNHVVSGGTTFEVVLADGTRAEAELVGTDVDSDLAVLKVPQLPEGVSPLPLAAGDDIQVGEFVVAIGNPFGEQGSMSLGIVSALGRSLRSQRNLATGSAYSLPEVIQTDAPINPGNSGGPLLNLDGAVVGVNSAIASTTGTNSGVGYSIPVQAVRQIVPSLISDGSYTYPYMGAGFDDEISLGDLEIYGVSTTQGAYVVEVTPGGPADEAGLIAADRTTGRGGDLVIAIDDQPVTDFEEMNGYLVFHTSAGQTIQLTILRGGEETTLPLTLAARP